MKEIAYQQQTGKVLEQLAKGAFLTTADGTRYNTMTIGWGSIGYLWGKPVFTVMVRHSRYSYELLEKHGEFTVSFPFDELKTAIALCGSKSGRDIDKFAAAKLTAQPGKKVQVPIIAECSRHYECKVIYKQDMLPDALDSAENSKWYGDNDYHTLYFGEIVASYTRD
jgi:flavin reductase (DIM6/NTAB) family NADH-FMN oxidoreductase RutF